MSDEMCNQIVTLFWDLNKAPLPADKTIKEVVNSVNTALASINKNRPQDYPMYILGTKFVIGDVDKEGFEAQKTDLINEGFKCYNVPVRILVCPECGATSIDNTKAAMKVRDKLVKYIFNNSEEEYMNFLFITGDNGFLGVIQGLLMNNCTVFVACPRDLDAAGLIESGDFGWYWDANGYGNDILEGSSPHFIQDDEE